MHNTYYNDTIAAPATPPGIGGVGIIRVSGPLVCEIAQHLFGKVPIPRFAHHAKFKFQQTTLDEGLAFYFSKPHSFTGEDVLELHGHGGPMVLNGVLQSVLKLGARLALPGEFSKRAFLNHKMDLLQAEAIADLIHAQSKEAAHCALRSLNGEFSKIIQNFKEALIELRMLLEAAIDFPEEDLDVLSEYHVLQKVEHLLKEITHITQTANQGMLLQEGIRLVIAGEPNTGKSSLLNQLAQKDAAIVSPFAGTTRDILKECIQIHGVPIHVFDTAGLRKTHNPIEVEGIRRAKSALENAEIIVWVLDHSQMPQNPAIIQDEYLQTALQNNKPIIFVYNKIDLTQEKSKITHINTIPCVYLSAKTNAGIDLLKETIMQIAGFQNNTEDIFLARRRHVISLTKIKEHLQNVLNIFKQKNTIDLLAEELRYAQAALNEITGEFTADDLLGKIFGTFCIGK